MSSGFHDPPFFHYHDLIGTAYRRKPMRNNDGCLALHQVCQSLLNKQLRLRIQSRSSFIEDKDRGIYENCPGDGDSLTLTAGKKNTAFADERVITLRKLIYKIGSEGDASGIFDLFITSVRLTI